MRFLSLFSGIEAASAAWCPLGWTCVGVAEIDRFPNKVLRHHHAGVPNLGDVTKITDEQVRALGRIDVVVFGSPCQDLSVAGKRAGLAGTRSGLFYDAIRIIRASGARFALWENVPGAFSSNKGRDFAYVLAALAGTDVDLPPKGWGTEGAFAGAAGLVEWSTLDAQWFGVAQRRRRVFALADFGDWTSRPAVLLESESLRGDSPPSREAGEGVAGTLSTRTKGGGGLGTDFDLDGGIHVTHSLRADGFDASEDGTGRGTPLIPVQPFDVANCLTVRMHKGINSTVDEGQTPVLAFDTTQITSPANRNNPQLGDPCHPLAAHAHAPAIAFSCKDHGADAANDVAPTLRAMSHGDSHANGGGQLAACFQTRIARNGRGGLTDIAPALNGTDAGDTSDMRPCVVTPTQVRRLTPLECERLQGFNDNFTLIPDGKGMAKDGPRYKALGNSMAVPVMTWIGKRLAAAVAANDNSESAAKAG